MRVLRAICAPAFLLALPGFIAFQVAARPMLSCGDNPCELLARIMPCLLLDSEVCESMAMESTGGCGRMQESVEPVTGCCASKAAPEPVKNSPCSGCAMDPDPEPLCASANSDSEGPAEGCRPDGAPLCALCPIIPVVAETVTSPRLRLLPVSILPAVHVPILLTEPAHGPEVIIAHAPPFSALARAGPELRIEFCSYRL